MSKILIEIWNYFISVYLTDESFTEPQPESTTSLVISIIIVCDLAISWSTMGGEKLTKTKLNNTYCRTRTPHHSSKS